MLQPIPHHLVCQVCALLCCLLHVLGLFHPSREPRGGVPPSPFRSWQPWPPLKMPCMFLHVCACRELFVVGSHSSLCCQLLCALLCGCVSFARSSFFVSVASPLPLFDTLSGGEGSFVALPLKFQYSMHDACSPVCSSVLARARRTPLFVAKQFPKRTLFPRTNWPSKLE